MAAAQPHRCHGDLFAGCKFQAEWRADVRPTKDQLRLPLRCGLDDMVLPQGKSFL